MVKLFLVEDEKIMRDGIKKHIDWKSEDIDFSGEASDGELAYPLILKAKPDILVTDIKMPFMDGLELSRLVKKELPDVKIIILSGYDEFKYAQEAVSIGVEEYLLKPISPPKLLETIKGVQKKIEENKKNESMLDDWSKEELLEKNAIEQQKLFRALVSGQMTMPELLEAGRKLDMDLTASFYEISIFNFTLPGETGDAYSEKQNAFGSQVLDEIDELDGCYLFDRGTEGFAILTLGESKEKVRKKDDDAIARIIDAAESIEDGNYFVGVGTPVNRLSSLGQSYDDANRAFSYRYFKEPNQVIYANEISSPGTDNIDVDVSMVASNEKSKGVYEKFLRSGSADEAHHFIKEVFSSFGEKNINSILFLNYITMDLYFATISFIQDLGYKASDVSEEFEDINSAIKSINNYKDAQAYLERGLEGAIALRDSNSVKKYSVILKKVMAYIDENYDKDDISLNTVASIANISPNHFSTIFSSEVGVTFIEYLINKRMEHARELLMTTNMRSSEIAYKVGYKDPHYFSYMFKKTQGMTTREYRARGK